MDTFLNNIGQVFVNGLTIEKLEDKLLNNLKALKLVIQWDRSNIFDKSWKGSCLFRYFFR